MVRLGQDNDLGPGRGKGDRGCLQDAASLCTQWAGVRMMQGKCHSVLRSRKALSCGLGVSGTLWGPALEAIDMEGLRSTDVIWKLLH